MQDIRWSTSEKKIARTVFEAALSRELGEALAELKSRAASAVNPEDMWSIREYLERVQREIDEKYDYRYSQLLAVFGRLLWEGRITEAELSGLSEEKLDYVRRFASLG
ncbi:MAG TPA: hypothetical protein PLT48_16305 [Nitrospira sp.]|nr:hypothetical protein [Nitrospira sp.]HMZ56417.1 hypothetical protein [Nitrospira sp.]HNA87448.1 hypothetical protein [Nitrospira sp.]